MNRLNCMLSFYYLHVAKPTYLYICKKQNAVLLRRWVENSARHSRPLAGNTKSNKVKFMRSWKFMHFSDIDIYERERVSELNSIWDVCFLYFIAFGWGEVQNYLQGVEEQKWGDNGRNNVNLKVFLCCLLPTQNKINLPLRSSLIRKSRLYRQ